MHAWQWRLQDFHTAVGKPTFPLFVAPPLIHPHGAARQYICPFSFPPLYAYASVSMPPSRTTSGVIFVAWGKGKDGIRNSNFLSKNLHALSGVVFCLKNLLILLPDRWEDPETKTTNAVGRRHKKTSDIQRGEKKKKPPTPNPNKVINNLKSENMRMILSDIGKVLWKALSAVVTTTSNIAFCASSLVVDTIVKILFGMLSIMFGILISLF